MWVRIDDHVPEHPKFLKAGPIAAWLWVCGNCHCNKYLTDGFIDEAAVKGLGHIPNARKHAASLVLVGLWECVEGGYRVHDYHDYNPRSEQIKAKREADRLRKQVKGEPAANSDAIPETFRAESDATPARIQRDSDAIPTRSHTRARARDPIPVPSQSPPIPSAVSERAPVALAGTLPRDHLRHGWCSSRGKCVPDFLHEEFVRAVGGDDRGARQRLKAFYEAVEAGWPEGPIGDKPVDLWRQEFAAKFPSVAPAKASPSGLSTAREVFVDSLGVRRKR